MKGAQIAGIAGIAALFAWLLRRGGSPASSASASEAAAPSGSPVGKTLPDVVGLRERFAAEPGLSKAYFDMVAELGWTDEHADYLAAAIGNIESGWKPDARNAASKATGLIQFMPDTAKAFGTTIDDLLKMTATEQMPYVKKQFANYKNLAPADIYPAIFMPSTVGKPEGKIVGTSTLEAAVAAGFSTEVPPGKKRSPADYAVLVYQQNRGLDVNKDGLLTAGDLRQKLRNAVEGARSKPRVNV
jgi:hypothetical protein